MRHLWQITTLLALFLLSMTAALAAEGEKPASVTEQPGFEIERVSWIGNAGEGGGVTVVNRFGDLRARFGGYEGQVEVFANVQHFDSEGPRLVVETVESAGGVEVTVGYRAAEGAELVTRRDPRHKKRADMVLYVPLGARLDASTDQGLIDVRGIKGDVRARTAAGEIKARKVDGELDFETGDGDILALLEQWDSERRHSFVSSSGDQWLYFGGEINAGLQVATSGLLSTDFSLEVDYQADRRPIKRAQGMVGKGSTVVTASSLDGHVRLIRRPLARKARARPEAER